MRYQHKGDEFQQYNIMLVTVPDSCVYDLLADLTFDLELILVHSLDNYFLIILSHVISIMSSTYKFAVAQLIISIFLPLPLLVGG